MAIQAPEVNRRTYRKTRVVKSYRQFDELFPAEEQIFRRFDKQFSGAVLDIAIGGGRTTRALLPKAASYIGFDFSQGMVDLAKNKYPQAEIIQLDMRETAQRLAGRSFDAILISYNGIDYISWEERNELLVALRTLLNSGGVLAFSTHNLAVMKGARRFEVRSDLRPDISALLQSPTRFMINAAKLPLWMAKAWPNYRRNRQYEKSYGGYAYINDSGENYGLLTLYVEQQLQIQSLKDSGFPIVEVLQPWLTDEPAAFNYFVAVR
jgi:SAM-dependent methyltransferase